MLTKLLPLIAAMFLSGCVPITPNISQNEEFAPHEGILIARFNSVQASGRLQIHQKIISFPYAAIQTEPGERQLKVIKIRGATDMRFSTYSVGNKSAYFDRSRFNFDVAPGTITYIGDIIVIEKSNTVSIRVVDNESETVDEAKALYPELFKKFRYVKSIPSNKQSD